MPGSADTTPSGAPPRATFEGAVTVAGGGPLAQRLRSSLAALGAPVEDDLHGAGPLSAAVFAPWDPAAVVPVALRDLTDAEFHAAWQQTMDDAVAFCVGARQRFAGRGGRIVLTTPTIALAGGDHHAHWAAAAEGVHLLAKSAARQWGAEGITVNALGVGPAEVLADPAAAGPVSIATPALDHSDPVAVCAFLCSPAAAHLTGQTLIVDGGLWM
jgi:NAD(P)-dependent dehydrogenase (short-subunit alcohol dehydrogenase family)